MYRAVRRGSIHYRKFPRAADDTVQRVRIAGAVDELHSRALFLKMGRDAPQQGRFAAAWAGLQKGRGLCFRIFYNLCLITRKTGGGKRSQKEIQFLLLHMHTPL